MKLGFTGTRQGMTAKQIEVVTQFLLGHSTRITEVHHGCCVGADAQFHWLVRKYLPEVRIIGHPSTLGKYTDQLVKQRCDELCDPYAPLIRNRHIIADSTHLLACPQQASEILRSGTWATIRYAKREAGITYSIITPTGEFAL